MFGFMRRKPKQLCHIDFVLHLQRKNPLKAIWRNRDFDQPVLVTGYYGKSPDKEIHYVQVHGSLSGIPLQELLFFI